MNQCEFSGTEVPSCPPYETQCPICKSIRLSVPRKGTGGEYRIFPSHAPLCGKPRNRACWKRDGTGYWTWHWWTPTPEGEEQK